MNTSPASKREDACLGVAVPSPAVMLTTARQSACLYISANDCAEQRLFCEFVGFGDRDSRCGGGCCLLAVLPGKQHK